MDSIEIALDYYTDFKKFENLATEIMILEGYTNIHQIGGISDDGIDGELVKFYENETKTTIFQYSLQKNLTAKINDTIKKLKINNVSFNELVIVTTTKVNNIIDIKAKVRKENKNNFTFEIYDRTLFISRLATNNDIFLRYFPDLKAQLTSDLFDRKTIFSEESKEPLVNSLLKCSLLFTFNPDANQTRSNLLDRCILSVVVSKKNTNAIQLQEIFKQKFNRILPEGQINVSLQRLVQKNLLHKNKDNSFSATSDIIQKIEGNSLKINHSTTAILNEIIQKVALSVKPDKIDKLLLPQLELNIKTSLSCYFRLYGLEYFDYDENINLFKFNFGIESNNDLIKLARKKLPKKIGDLLIYHIGETLKTPTVEQAMILGNWAKAFIGIQIMSLDAVLNEFQITRLSKKTFILDTDFILDCIIENNKTTSLYLKLIKELKKIGCQIIIPDDVILEVVNHAEYAKSNFYRLNKIFSVLDDIVVEESIRNLYIRGFYIAAKKNRNLSFKTYIANYYNEDDSEEFMLELIKYKFDNKTIYSKDITILLSNQVPIEISDKLTNEIYNEIVDSEKAKNRDEDQCWAIAQIDSRLFLTTMYLNKKSKRADRQTILPGQYYLLTSSVKPLRCANKIGIKEDVTIKPQTLISLLDQIGSFEIKGEEVLNMFENPYLIEIVNESWEDIKTLINSGAELKGKNPIQLQYDLEKAIHETVSQKDLTKNIESKEIIKTEYFGFVSNLRSMGYKFIPEVEKIIKTIENERIKREKLVMEKNKAIEDKEIIENQFNEINDKISEFNRKKQNYIKRMIENQNRKK